MPKIIYVANVALPTGWAHGYQIMKTCAALVAQGANVELVVTDRIDPTITVDAFQYYGVSRTFKITKLHVIDVLHRLPGWLAGFAFLLERWTFTQALKRFLPTLEDADVVYVRDAHLAERLSVVQRIPVVYEMHVIPNEKAISRIRNVAKIACLTSSLERRVKESFPQRPVAVIPDAVDMQVFDPVLTQAEARVRLGIPQDALVVVYGGQFATLGSGKGLAQLDLAITSLGTEFPELVLFLIGGASSEFVRVEGRDPSQRTTCVPFMPRESVAVYYRAADVLAMPFPKTPHYEEAMSPLKMFEYMASGTPIVSSDLRSVRDVLDEQTAFLYDAEDAEGLRQAIRKALLTEASVRDGIGGAAKRRVRERYTWDARAKGILSLIYSGDSVNLRA